MDTDYRSRLYARYAGAREGAPAPASTADLQPRAAYLTDLIRRHFPADRAARVLDLGCGHGALLHFARRAGYNNLRGVDTSPEQVAAARRLDIHGVELGDVLQTLRGLSEGACDVVVAFDVIEHFTKPEVLEVVDEVRRVLASGGRWILHAPNGESPFAGRIRYGDFTHELAFTHESLSQLLLCSGFSEVRCFEDRPVIHGVVSALRWVSWMCIRALLRFYLAAETGDLAARSIFSQNLLAVAVKARL